MFMHTKNSTFTDWLQWFYDPDAAYGPKGPLAMPDGSRMATNNIVAVVTNTSGLTVDYEGRRGNQADHVVKLLAQDAAATGEYTYDEMRAAFGEAEHPSEGKCQKCEGTGSVEHRCNCDLCHENIEDCPDCGGEGTCGTEPERRSVPALGCLVDANIVAYVVEHAPRSDAYQVGVIANAVSLYKSVGVLRIVTSEWSALIVGLELNENASDGDENTVEVLAKKP